MGETKHEEIEAVTAMVAVGIVVLIASARAGLAYMIEEWRALVFLLINLVLLTILFISIRSNSNKHQPNNPNNPNNNNNNRGTDLKKKKKKKKRRTERSCGWSVGVVEEVLLHNGESNVLDDDDKDDGMSKEELNARVEAFIAMFKQQLALDAQDIRSS